MRDSAGITVVTWNAQGSQGMEVTEVAAALGQFDADVVLLQEVQRHQVGQLRLGLDADEARWRFKHWPVRIPAEGLGILSRLPLVDVRVQPLARAWRFWDWRRRVAVHAGVVVGDQMVRVVNTHLGAGVPRTERTRQARALLDASAPARIIGGDLNAAPGDPELAPFAARGFVDAERRHHAGVAAPATNWRPGPRTAPPTQRLDYVMVRSDVEVVEAFVPTDHQRWAARSDHLPVVARLRV
jgi:endonuclease/exonuclease/phosphatase family metal-dependent hydrolase